MADRLVIVGNGMAAGRVLEHLTEAAPGRYEVTVFGAEPRVNYDRIMLSPVLSGEKRFEDIVIHDDAWYAARNIELRKGFRVGSIDREKRLVRAEGGSEVRYEKLLIATGSNPIIVPIPGANLEGVIAYRDLDDVEKMLQVARSSGHAVVIGGGLLGLEAAAGLKARGMDVSVLHLMPTLMERQLDPAAGYLLQRAIEARGIRVLTKANTQGILGKTRVEGVLLADGTELPADIVVMAVGIRPNVELAKAAGLTVNRGIIVNDAMTTNDPNIYSVGECVEHRGTCYGLVAPLYEMASVAAARLAGDVSATYSGSVISTKLKVTGIDLFSAGDFAEAPDREEIVLRDAARSIYRRLVIKECIIIGAVLYGDTSDGAWFFDQMKRGADISTQRETLIFGQAFAGGAPLDPMAAVATLPDEAQICGCNGVAKGKITAAITSLNLSTLEDVRAHTKASASCGSCTPLVEKLMKLTLGEAFNPKAVTPMCPCTDLGHDEVRRHIAARHMTTIAAVMQELNWKTSGGCAKCRPALNYYLLATFPGQYRDDQQSRFVNERLHANIQRDGSYSVVPRMFGGITNARELRAIADVVDKFDIPTVKVTGGQRIDLLGVKKEDLPAVWRDLGRVGLVSGHAYGKALRTVKTCVGTDWCRFGTQDSTGLGIKIEKFMWGSWTPAKVKMAVSGCPRNCAEATCKDVGVVCVESGFDIHFAGAAGLDIKGTEVLTHVATEDEALEVIVALVQLYREQGRYLERIYKWAKRVGIESIRAQAVDDLDRRQTLFERFAYSQSFSQKDPWAERAAGSHAGDFTPMSKVVLETLEEAT